MVSEKTENNNEETGNTVTRKTRSEIERAEKTRIALEAINNDDWLHILDVVFMVNLVLDSSCPWQADMNDDGACNIIDVLLLVNLIFG